MTGYVYAISNDTGAVKIGWSEDPVARFRQFRTVDGRDCVLHGYAEGTRAHETAIHEILSPACVRGEWFDEKHPHVVLFLSMLPRPGPRGVPPKRKEVTPEALALIADIEAFCRDTNLSETYVGVLLANDGKFIASLRRGRQVLPRTEVKIRADMAAERAARLQTA